MSTFVRWLAVLVVMALSVTLAQRVIRRVYKKACEEYSVVGAVTGPTEYWRVS